jgi:hypothetical protein
MTIDLDRVSIASPCSADWNQMVGDDKRRYCGQCQLHVHDLGAMTTAEAEALLQNVGKGRTCVRFFRRADGKVLTKDCPVGLRQRLARTWARATARAAALWLALWTSVGCSRAPVSVADPSSTETPTAPTPPTPSRPHMGEACMGDVAAPTPTPPAPAPVNPAKAPK